ncbi:MULTISPECIES: ribonuclease domain-containing protein [unclassified Streptomyces]|uniref:ribonuclease domain-containing protein n=1 Tax=unclassified Streptomyces TaxID=2593676 RepID=UPI000F45DB5E|nr:ribonuclease domain-containing protein [Streptomyces sp. I6]RNL73990.1 ribonuclease N1 [Streptomyces sp. I6]
MLNRSSRLLLVLLSALTALLLTGCPGGGAGTGHSPAASVPAALATVRTFDLPREARRTLRLIDDGGPFPYRKDGSAFGNLEGMLPDRERGYYREYTVPTPGERDRGARRIVTGREGEVYYTDDHYQTFRVVLR